MRRYQKTCPHCGGEYETTKKTQKYCSKKCLYASRRKDGGVPSVCKDCGKEFMPKAADRLTFCSRECSFEFKRKNAEVFHCWMCGKDFKRVPEHWHTNICPWCVEHLDIFATVCKVCGKGFRYSLRENNFREKVVCSRECKLENGRRRYRDTFASARETNSYVEKTCLHCGKLFETNYYANWAAYCSKECREEAIRLDPKRRVDRAISKGIQKALRGAKNGRPWESLVGYSCTDLVQHLEGQFRDGMSWDNYGEWSIDHILPRSLFKYETAESTEFRACWAIDNLRPLWAEENSSKGASLELMG